MNKEEITKEDILNVTGSMFDTMFDYVENSDKQIEQLEQENKQLKEKIDKITEYIEKHKNILMGFYEEVDGNVIKKILKGEGNE